MVGRKGGLSGKQKSALLKEKRAQVRERAGGAGRRPDSDGDRDGGGRNGGFDSGTMNFLQQVSKQGVVNSLSTRFVRDDDEAVAARKLRGGQPFEARPDSIIFQPVWEASLGLPTRPGPLHDAAAQEAAERDAFDSWLEDIHSRFTPEELSPYALPIPFRTSSALAVPILAGRERASCMRVTCARARACCT